MKCKIGNLEVTFDFYVVPMVQLSSYNVGTEVGSLLVGLRLLCLSVRPSIENYIG
jgi:hypothetical protein